MSNLQVISNNQVTFSEEQVSVIKNQITHGATDLELKSFLWQCQRTGLDPFARQIYFIKSNGKVQIQTSIDGFRLIAERSGQYEGQTRPRWCGKDGVWKDIWTDSTFPFACEVGVYKKGQREPTYGLAKWDEYAGQNPQFMWKKMPAHMLAKVAESLALRKAFPNEMSGLYTQEEMGVATSTVKPEQPSDEDGSPEALLLKPYTFPFGSLKFKTPSEVLKTEGRTKLENVLLLIEEKLSKGETYKGVTEDQMKKAVREIEIVIAKAEMGEGEDEAN